MRRPLPLLAFAAGVALVACSDPSGDPSTPFQIAFDSLPSPSVVAGDTMRDSAGHAVRLHADVFNASGAPLPDAEVVFIPTTRGTALRTTNEVLPGGYVIARPDSFSDGVNVVAQAGRLQSVARTLDVVRAPTTLRVAGSTLFETRYRAGIDSGLATLRVIVGYVSNDTLKPVKSWPVRFTVVYPAGAQEDPDAAAFLVADSASLRRSRVDTTGSDGVAARAVRLRPNRLRTPVDSLVVEANASYKAPLSGSPIRFVVRFAPRA